MRLRWKSPPISSSAYLSSAAAASAVLRGRRLRLELALRPGDAAIAAREVGAVRADGDDIRAVAEHVEQRLPRVRRVVRALPGVAGVRGDERDLVVADGHAVLLIGETHGREHFLRGDTGGLRPRLPAVVAGEHVTALAHGDEARAGAARDRAAAISARAARLPPAADRDRSRVAP